MPFSFLVTEILDLQCSTDDDEDDEEDFQEVSEDENNAAHILDQGERMHAPNDTMDYIDPKNIKTEVDIDAQQMAGGLIGQRCSGVHSLVCFCVFLIFEYI